MPTTLLLAAIHTEIAPTLTQLHLRPHGRAFIGESHGSRLAATVTGIGAARAQEAFAESLADFNPNRIILLGFAGGLDPRLQPGAAFRIDWVANPQGRAFNLRAPIPRATADDPQTRPPNALLTLDHPAHTAADKQRLFQQYNLPAVDMETYHLAALAADHALPLTVFRAVSDPAGLDLPTQSSDWIAPDGSTNTWAAAKHLLTHPWHTPTMLKLRRYANLAAHNLADKVCDSLTRDTPTPASTTP